jgi:hypothetical protein
MSRDGMNEITTDEILDSRDIIARINYLIELQLDNIIDPGETIELFALTDVEEEAAAISQDWPFGAAMIRADYFPTFVRQYAEEFSSVSDDTHWPFNHIDWDAAVEDLRDGYEELYFDGVKYYLRRG